MKVSERGLAFIAAREGLVSKAYLCPAGVVTIGYGFTMGSTVFAAWWLARHGRVLRLGDRISKSNADMLLPKVFDEEYGRAVERKIGTGVQTEYDGSGSVTFNCGTGALNWVWAKLLKARDVKGCAKRLRTTAVTANGRRLDGLVQRRRDEANLIETGNYGPLKLAVPPSVSSSMEAVRQYQKQLLALGYPVGVSGADGVAGKDTLAAVEKFQADNGLVIDSKVGPATRAALIRALDAKRGKQAITAAPVAGGGGSAGLDSIQPHADQIAHQSDLIVNAILWGGGTLIAVLIAILLLRWRGVLTGRRVPT